MNDSFAKILWQAYEEYLLPLGGKRVPAPYRRNEAGSFQKIGPEFQGKSAPAVLVEATERLAKEQGFDLNKASAEEIRGFMRKNKLGIDCSGFAYRTLNFSLQKAFKKNLTDLGLPHVGRTNVAKLTSDEFTVPVSDFSQVQSGDIIRLNSGGDVLHCLVVLENKNDIISYAHSSGETIPSGVHADKIVNGTMPKDLKVFSYNPVKGDGIRRLKVFDGRNSS